MAVICTHARLHIYLLFFKLNYNLLYYQLSQKLIEEEEHKIHNSRPLNLRYVHILAGTS